MGMDLVKETTLTTGTGSYALEGAADGYLALTTVLPGDGAGIPYIARAGSTLEVGVGTLSGAGTTLARTEILGGSNGTFPVAWPAGEKEIYIGPTAYLQPPVRHRQDGVPDESSDVTGGYGRLSFVLGGSDDDLYVCVDSSAAAAVWMRLLQVAPTGNDYIRVHSNGRLVLGFACSADEPHSAVVGQNNTSYASHSFMSGNSGLNPWQNGSVVGGGVGSVSVGMSARVPITHYSTDATPAVIGSLNSDTPTLPGEGAMYVRAMVLAKEANAADVKCWLVEALVLNTSGTLSIVGTHTVTGKFATAGADAWALAFGVSGDELQLIATGEAAHDIEWTATLDAAALLDDTWSPP